MEIRLVRREDWPELQRWYAMPYINRFAFHGGGFENFVILENSYHFVGEIDHKLIGHAFVSIEGERLYFTHIIGRKGMREIHTAYWLFSELYAFLPEHFPSCQFFEGYVVSTNVRALAFSQSIGLKPTLTRRQLVFVKGRYADLHVFSLSAEEMRNASAQAQKLSLARQN